MPKDRYTQPFAGYAGPNFTQIPDQLFDEQLPDLSGAELKVLLYIMRRTFGFKKESDNISLSQICSGITTKDGRVLDRGTGLSKDSAARAIKGLEEKHIIIRIRRRSAEKGDEPTTYALHIAPVSDYRTPPREKIGHPPPRKSDTQYTVEQNTARQDTDISNIRMASTQPKIARTEEDTPAQEAAPSKIRPLSLSEKQEGDGSNPLPTASSAGYNGKHLRDMSQNGRGGTEPVGTTIQRRRGRPTAAAAEARRAIVAYIEDFAREFNDQAPLKSSTTLALNLMQEAEMSLSVFISALLDARAITKERTANIRATVENGKSAWPQKNKMGYFFSVLEDQLGLREPTPIDADHDQPAEGSHRRR